MHSALDSRRIFLSAMKYVSLPDIFALVDSAEFTASDQRHGNTATATVTQGEQRGRSRLVTLGT